MPFEITTFRLPCGGGAARIEYWGLVTGEEAAEVIRRLDTGGPLYGMSTLSVAVKEHTISPEARAIFTGYSFPAVVAGAMVNTNLVTRVIANFIVRARRASHRMRFFATEAEAIQWMDERVREVQAAQGKS